VVGPLSCLLAADGCFPRSGLELARVGLCRPPAGPYASLTTLGGSLPALLRAPVSMALRACGAQARVIVSVSNVVNFGGTAGAHRPSDLALVAVTLKHLPAESPPVLRK